MKIISLSNDVVISDPGQFIGQIQVTNVLPGNYHTMTKIVNGEFGKEISQLGLLHEDYFKQPKKWNWLMGHYLKTETGRIGIFSKETYQKDTYFDAYYDDNLSWFQRICHYIFEADDKWECYHRGVALLVGPGKNDFCVYVAKNDENQIVGFAIDLYVEPKNNDFVFKELGLRMTINEYDF